MVPNPVGTNLSEDGDLGLSQRCLDFLCREQDSFRTEIGSDHEGIALGAFTSPECCRWNTDLPSFLS